MFLAEYLRPNDIDQLRLFKQLGVNAAVLRLPEADTNAAKIDLTGLAETQKRFELEGVKIAVIEPVPPMEAVKQGEAGRDSEIARLETLIRGMGRLGIPVLCYNFMAVFGWLRTGLDVVGRGGAQVTGFSSSEFEKTGLVDRPISDEQMWDNYEFFLSSILPVAEEAGVTLALHPDDPPLSPLRGVARIFRSPEAIERAMSMSSSPSHKLTFCQGTFAEMGVDIPETIRSFADRIAFVHLRDVRGDAHDFVETFHDEGRTDMFAAAKAYVDIEFAGPVRMDHVPTMHGESNERPGYETLGRLFAIGYFKGLFEGAMSESSNERVEN